MSSILAASALFLASVQAGSAALASNTTCGAPGNYHAGFYYDPPSPQQWGAQANVTVEVSNLCSDGADSDSSAWAMLASDNSTTLYSQIGYLHKNYGNVNAPLRFFYEWARSGMVASVYFGVPVIGENHNFRVSTYGNPLRIHNLLDTQAPTCGQGGSPCSVTDFSPFDPSSGWIGTNAEWYGETLHPGDDIAGSYGTPTPFTTVQHTDGSGWLYQLVSPPDVACPYYHASTGNSTTSFTIWTDPFFHNSTCN